jgi:TRAP-type C4-dicarboxylate transport system permease small subunit
MLVRHFIERLNAALALAAGICMLVLTVLTTSEVISRYVFNAPTSWSLEVIAYLLVFCVFFGMAYSIKKGAHVSIPLIYSHFSKRNQRILDIATSILLLAFWIVLLWQSLAMAIDYLVKDVRSETMLATPLFYPMLLVAIGSFTSCLEAIIIIYDNFVGAPDKSQGNTH